MHIIQSMFDRSVIVSFPLRSSSSSSSSYKKNQQKINRKMQKLNTYIKTETRFHIIGCILFNFFVLFYFYSSSWLKSFYNFFIL